MSVTQTAGLLLLLFSGVVVGLTAVLRLPPQISVIAAGSVTVAAGLFVV